MIGRNLSHFRIVAKIGEGGMGVVYRAEDEKLRRPVAIKVLPPDLTGDEERRMRFLREARAAAAVIHPNIAAIHEIDEADGIVFIAMELVEGRTLRQLMGGRPLSVKEALGVATQTADALARAHQAQVIHRDLKPENVVVSGDGRVKLLDFGLAKLPEKGRSPEGRGGAAPDADPSRLDTISGEMTREGRIFGTAAYMSPEQARGLAVDARSDIFSFGTTLYEMVTGRAPFQGKTATDVLSAIVRDEPAPPSRINAEVPYELERVIGKCLEKDPAERYQHTDELVVDLRKLKRTTDSGLQVVGPAAAAGAQAARRRSRALVAAGAAVIVLMAAAAGAYWLSQRGGGGPSRNLKQTPLTSNPVEEAVQDAALSPDGRYLAYVDPAGLHIRLIDTGEAHALQLDAGLEPLEVDWFPDGSRLVMTLFRRPGPGAGGEDAAGTEARAAPAPAQAADGEPPPSFQRVGVWSVSILGGAPRLLRDRARRPAVSPDGTQIVFLDLRQTWFANEIWRMGSGGEEPRRIAALDKGDVVTWAGWSPDGRRIVYGRFRYGTEEHAHSIESRSLDGADPVVLVSNLWLFQDWHGVLRACWLADGRLIYSLSEPPPNEVDSNLWEVRVDAASSRAEGEPGRLTDWAGHALRYLSASRDGKRLAFLRTRQQPDVFVGELDPATRKLQSSWRLTSDERVDYPNEWARDSSAVIFFSKRRGRADIFKQGIHEKEARPLIAGPRGEAGAELTPDGSDLLYWEFTPEGGDSASPRARLMKAPAAGGVGEPLIDPATQADSLACSGPGSARCVLAELSGTRLTFYELDPARGKGAELAAAEIGPSPLFGWDISPDGARIALVNFEDEVRILTLADRSKRVLRVRGWQLLEDVVWDPLGGLFVRGSREHGSAILHVGLDGSVRVVTEEPVAFIVWPLPSPDGRYLAFAKLILESNAWMVEGF